MMSIAEDALRALEAKGAAERDLARIAVCPPWRHAAFAGVMAALIVSPAVALPLRFAVLTCAFAAIAIIVQSDRRRLGVFINGYRRGRTRLVTFPLLAVMLLLGVGSFYASDTLGRPLISVVLAAVAFVAAYCGSVLWQKVFVRELGR